jgi:spore maturation protein CgeB
MSKEAKPGTKAVATLENAEAVSESRDSNYRRNRVLIVAPAFRHYGEMIQRAFADLDWDAILYEQQQMQLTTLNGIRWWSSRRFQDRMFHQMMLSDTKAIITTAIKFRPHLVLIVNGDRLQKKELKMLKEMGATLALWCYDSVSHCPCILDSISVLDHVLVFEPSDVPILSDYGIQSSVLPLAYDPTLYFPIPSRDKEYDMSFVGTLFSYPDRLRLLRKVVSTNPRIKIGIFTNTPPVYSPKKGYALLSPFSPFLRTVEMRSITHSQINEIYNSSKMCLNYHHEQSKEGLNPRVFEILGSGAFQLVDHKRQLSDLFDVGKEVTCYDSENDLLEKIRYFLDNPHEGSKIANRGEQRVRSMHTYGSRIKHLLRVVNL